MDVFFPFVERKNKNVVTRMGVPTPFCMCEVDGGNYVMTQGWKDGDQRDGVLVKHAWIETSDGQGNARGGEGGSSNCIAIQHRCNRLFLNYVSLRRVTIVLDCGTIHALLPNIVPECVTKHKTLPSAHYVL